MQKFIKYILILIFTSTTLFTIAQRVKKRTIKTVDRMELEVQRQSLLQEIKETQLKLGELQKDKTATISQLEALQQKLGAREALIGNINKEINYLESNITEAKDDAQILGEDLLQMKKRYAELVRYSYKKKSSQNILLFLFSSSSFNDALRRYKYVKQYRDYRKGQSDKIQTTSKTLDGTIAELNERKMQKDAMRKTEEEQKLVIKQEEIQKNSVVQNLKGQEAVLMQRLIVKQKTAQDLNNAITTAIKREIELARKKAADERRRVAKIKAMEEKRLREEKRQADLALQRERDKEREQERTRERERVREQDLENKRIKDQAELNKRNKAIAGKNAKELTTKDKNAPKGKKIASGKNNNIPEIPKENIPIEKPSVKTIPKQTNENDRAISRNSETPKPLEPTKRVVPTQVVPADDNKVTKYSDDLSDDARSLSINFEQNKGNLSGPVNGYVSSHFGKNKHPMFNIYEENFGIDIRTSKGSIAKSVFGGEVVSIFYIAGAGNNILVNHGNYFTLYSKIDKVAVAKGQKIRARTPLGSVLTDAEGNTQVHFEIWKVGSNNVPVKVNPEQWIRL
jgi:murein hydrolase activator